jgi:hypothetical protein
VGTPFAAQKNFGAASALPARRRKVRREMSLDTNGSFTD